MKPALLIALAALALTHPAFGQGAPDPGRDDSPGTKVPDFLGFYALNIPGFVWEPGTKVTAEYQRYTGLLNLAHTSKPSFVTEHRDPIPLSLDQASRLLLGYDLSQPFDLVGLAVHTSSPGGEADYFVVFTAVIGGKQVNMIPTLTSKAASTGPGGPPGGGRLSGGAGGISGQF